MSMESRYKAIEQEVEERCRLNGRTLASVRIVAVSKTVGVDKVGEAVHVGVRDFGENRPDMLLEKQEAYPDVNWHFIGNIQSRRIGDIVQSACLIHSLYQVRHLDRIEKAARACHKVQDVLVEVNVSGEESKGGLEPECLSAYIDECLKREHIRVCGLMTMAPQGDAESARTCFEHLARLRDDMGNRYETASLQAPLHELSMGMSEDWREAIDAGATIIRIGRAVFSESFEK